MTAYINNENAKDKWGFLTKDLLEGADYTNDLCQPIKDTFQKQEVFQQSSSLQSKSKCKDIVDLL